MQQLAEIRYHLKPLPKVEVWSKISGRNFLTDKQKKKNKKKTTHLGTFRI